MESLSLKEIRLALEGELIGSEEVSIEGVSINTRTLKKGDLFFAIKGENFDGHQFIEEAFSKGANAAIVSKNFEPGESLLGRSLIFVNHTTEALQKLAKHWRDKFDIIVVGVTGSTGKTTTKDMIYSVLSQRYKTLKTQGNFNNEIGLPLTLLRLDSSYEALVVEMGMRGMGQIEELAQIAQPDIGVITNVSCAHIELLKSIENIAKAKSELISSLDKSGVSILNGDDNLVRGMEKISDGKVINYGLNNYNKVRATKLALSDDGNLEFYLEVEGLISGLKINLPVPGKYNVYNALAAISVGFALGIDLEKVGQGLIDFELTPLRNRVLESNRGFKVIDDTYNANPSSMRAALETLVEIKGQRSFAVLGDMLELGEFGEKEHSDLGKFIFDKEVDYLFTYGDLASQIAKGAKDSGMEGERVSSYRDKEELVEGILEVLDEGDVVLVKGSRGMKLEDVSQALEER